MKLGILTVYLVVDDGEWILRRHLEHLAATEAFMEFKVYAAVNRLDRKYLPILSSYTFVEVIELPHLDMQGSAEHGAYLDLLAACAIGDECDWICTFDMDSWPIHPDWIVKTVTLSAETAAPAVAVLRAENGDRVLPHPMFCFVRSDVFRMCGCRFSLAEREHTYEYQRFLKKNHQHGDTGAAVGFALAKHDVRWTPLLRSNRVNLHYLMGGIYGDLIFHVGASSRAQLIFRGDDPTWMKWLVGVLNLIPFCRSAKRSVVRLLKRITYEPSVTGQNRLAYDQIRRAISHDEISFYRELMGRSRDE